MLGLRPILVQALLFVKAPNRPKLGLVVANDLPLPPVEEVYALLLARARLVEAHHPWLRAS